MNSLEAQVASIDGKTIRLPGTIVLGGKNLILHVGAASIPIIAKIPGQEGTFFATVVGVMTKGTHVVVVSTIISPEMLASYAIAHEMHHSYATALDKFVCILSVTSVVSVGKPAIINFLRQAELPLCSRVDGKWKPIVKKERSTTE